MDRGPIGLFRYELDRGPVNIFRDQLCRGPVGLFRDELDRVQLVSSGKRWTEDQLVSSETSWTDDYLVFQRRSGPRVISPEIGSGPRASWSLQRPAGQSSVDLFRDQLVRDPVVLFRDQPICLVIDQLDRSQLVEEMRWAEGRLISS